MSLIGYIRELDRKFAWSFLGVLLALLFGGITIQREFFGNSSPHLRYDILTSTPVLDVREDVSKLSVLFDGIDIREQKKSLRVITVRVVNDSQSDILKAQYDDAEPLGLHLSTGRIIRSDMVAASNPYLERQLVLHQRDDTVVNFSSVILESQEYFVVKILVLHDEDKRPEITPVGKIAGIRSIAVTEAYKQEVTPPFLQRTFGGNVAVQGVRLVSYAISMIFVLVAIIAPVAFIGSRVGAGKRRRLVDEFKQLRSRDLVREDEFFSAYLLRTKASRCFQFCLSCPMRKPSSRHTLATRHTSSLGGVQSSFSGWKRTLNLASSRRLRMVSLSTHTCGKLWYSWLPSLRRREYCRNAKGSVKQAGKLPDRMDRQKVDRQGRPNGLRELILKGARACLPSHLSELVRSVGSADPTYNCN